MNEETKNLMPRPPIVVVMGHIDHGKTTLLDYIRKTSVAAKESGGITQHIGAYEAEANGKKITFIDTPGHEAFSKMRSRGTRVADIATLVVAADDGVKPQTKEALAAIKSAGIPFLVAINKIDKPNANPERAKNELAESGVFLEGRGGNVPYVEISAKEGTNVPKLLETILLLSELESLTADLEAAASGVVIESHCDSKRGMTATLLVRNGTLKKGMYVAAGEALTKVRILEDFSKKSILSAGPSSPTVVVGFDKAPSVGAEFKTFDSQKEAEETRGKKPTPLPPPFPREGEKEGGMILPSLSLVIKTDVLGSAEAIEHEIKKLKDERVNIKILRVEAGDISEDDVKLASSGENPFIIGFKVGVHLSAKEWAERLKVEIAVFEIIYELADFLKEKVEKLRPKETLKKVLGKAQIIKIFPSQGKNQIAGGKVLEGLLKRGAGFNLLRRDRKIGEGKIENLQTRKLDALEVEAGNEFGAMISSKMSVAQGDIIEVFD